MNPIAPIIALLQDAQAKFDASPTDPAIKALLTAALEQLQKVIDDSSAVTPVPTTEN